MDNEKVISELNGRIDTKVSEKAAEIFTGLEKKASIEDVKNVKSLVSDLEAQIKAMEDKAPTDAPTGDSVENFLKSHNEVLAAFAKGQKNGGSIYMKAATDVISTANTVVSGDRVATSYLPGIVDAKRVRTNILPYLTLGTAASSSISWFEYVNDEGEYECVDECALKPSLNWNYKQVDSNAKKLAAHTRICDEMWDDVPFVGSITREVHRRLHDEKLNEYVTTEIKATAGAYVNPAYSGTITSPNFWDALEAVIVSGTCLGCNYTEIMVSCERYYQFFSAKDANGAYTVHPALSIQNGVIYFMGVELVINHYLAADEYLAGSFGDAKLLAWKDFEIKSGHINDDFIHNISTYVGESRFLFFIPDNCKVCFQTGTFAAVLTDIVKP